MHLDTPFLKLPIRFSAEALAAEVRALPKSAWVPHPTGFVGNEAVRLVTPGGLPTDDLEGEMAPTEHLDASPYLQQVMDALGGVWGRSRLMGLGPGGEVPQHVDSHYYWRTHWRIHVPIVTSPAVLFTCGPETVHMAAGECWLFDSFRWHKVVNGGTEQRIHLVLDTVGGDRFWDLLDAARAGNADPFKVEPKHGSKPVLAFEKVNAPEVMSPWEMRVHVQFLKDHVQPHSQLAAVLARVDRFVDEWAVAWARFEADAAGLPLYRRLLDAIKGDLIALGAPAITLRNKLQFLLVFDHVVLVNALAQPLRVPAPVAATA